MNLQAYIGQASFNCYLGPHVWVKCLHGGCGELLRVSRENIHEEIIRCPHCGQYMHYGEE